VTAAACRASPDECAGRLRLPARRTDHIFLAVDEVDERRRSDRISAALCHMSIETLACPLPEYALPRAPQVATRTLPRGRTDNGLSWPRCILVASDGSPSSDAAIVAARFLAERCSASVEMAAVYSPRIPLPPSAGRHGFKQCEAPERGEAATLLRAVHNQRRRLLLAPRDWPLRLEVGDPGGALVHMAKEASADLVVLGIGAPNPVDRRYAAHTASCVARYLQSPLCAVAPQCEAPVRCVVALPDGRAHAPTLGAAVAILPVGARIWIASPDGSFPAAQDDARPESARELVARAGGPELASRLDTPEVERVGIVGDMLSGVLRVADDVEAQLIAIPNHGDPGSIRAFLPNLAEPLLAAARCSVLVVPDQAAPA
jgi:nucleotide-binding universal stress UspA family protein